MPRLTYTLDGESRSVEVEDSCSIGKMDTNTIVLADEPGASRRHCQIMKLSNSYELTDLDSTNGTLVNGKKVKRHRLEPGDRIQIGQTLLKWADGDGEIELEDEISLEEPGGGGGKGGSGASAQCYLVFAGGERDGEKLSLDVDRVTFGRKSSNTVPLEDNAVSGYHCEVAREGGAYVLRDLGSTNGTLLDAEPVTEVALEHGGRIRIGGVRLVFIDPAVSEFEGAMTAMDDLGSEWGLLRAEMDMERVTKARRSQVISVIGVLVVIGIGAYLALGTDLLKPKAKAIAAIEGNRVEDFSFEERSGGWAALANTPTRASYGDNDAVQGSSLYQVQRDGHAEGAAVAESDKPITVRPGTAYEFGAHARAGAGASANVRVRWVGAGESDVTQYCATTLSEASGWTELRATAVPPSGTTAAHVQLVNAGTGTAAFDDVVFREASGAAGGKQATDGELSIIAAPDGGMTLLRGQHPLLQGAMVVAGAMRPVSSNQARRMPRVGAAQVTSIETSGGGLKVTGKCRDPETGNLEDFTFAFVPGEDEVVQVQATLPEDAALLAELPTSFVVEGVGVFRVDGTSLRLSETRTIKNVNEVFLGENRPFQMKLPTGEAFSVALFARDSGWELGIGGGAELSIPLRTNAQDLIRERNDLVRQMDEAAARKLYGHAIQLAGQVIGKFPEGHGERQKAIDLNARLVAEGEAALAALARGVDAAIQFNDAGDLRAAVKTSAELAERYDRYRIHEDATALGEKAQAALAARRTSQLERSAQPVLTRAHDFRDRKQVRLARALYSEVVARYAGTDAAREAQAELSKLEGR